MRVSAFSVVDAYDPARDRAAEFLRLASAAERLGLHGVWVAEHHFDRGGVCPAPPVLLSAVAARTHHLRLGPMAAILPFHEPIALAESYAMLDRLSGGRLRIGVGSGYLPVEFETFGVPGAERHARFEAALAAFTAALRGEPLGPAHRSRLNVAPVQRPNPPIWVAARHPESLRDAVRDGRSVAILPYATVDDLEGLGRLVEELRALSELSRPRPQIGVVLHLASEATGAARRALQRFLDSRLAARGASWRGDAQDGPRRATAADLEERGFACFGERAMNSRLGELAELGVDEVLGSLDFGGRSPFDSERAMARLARGGWCGAARATDARAGSAGVGTAHRPRANGVVAA